MPEFSHIHIGSHLMLVSGGIVRTDKQIGVMI